MENILNYNNRDLLYKDLVRKLNLKKVDQKYYKEYFGDFYVTLSNDYFLLKYVNERSYLTIRIASQFELKWFDLSYLCELVFNTKIAGVCQKLSNIDRIAKFNQFLIDNFEAINKLFEVNNYQNTIETLDKLTKENFIKNFQPNQ